MMFEVDCHAVSDIGVEHHVSRDRFFIADVAPGVPSSHSMDKSFRSRYCAGDASNAERNKPRRWSRMFGVAHGVPGLPAADRACEIVVETARNFVTDSLHNRSEWRSDSLCCTLTAVPGRCVRALSEDVAKNPWERGLGSTLTLAHVDWPRLYLMHVGDCRCYLGRDSQIQRLTADQIVDGTLAERGVVAAESRPSLRRRTLWSFIGDTSKNLKPQVSEHDLRIGDTLVLCTSGLVQEIADDRIAELLADDPPAEDACARLVTLAHELGGTEDMTVIVARFREKRSTPVSGRETPVSYFEPNNRT